MDLSYSIADDDVGDGFLYSWNFIVYTSISEKVILLFSSPETILTKSPIESQYTE